MSCASQIIFTTESPEQTRALAAALAGLCDGGEVFLLDGDLGAGKTCFTQGFGMGLGVMEDITSPTYTLHCQYEGALELNHIDAYRLEDDEHVEALGFDELFVEGRSVTVIEWPQMLQKILPHGCVHVYIRTTSETGREFCFTAEARPATDFISKLQGIAQELQKSTSAAS